MHFLTRRLQLWRHDNGDNVDDNETDDEHRNDDRNDNYHDNDRDGNIVLMTIKITMMVCGNFTMKIIVIIVITIQ